jgi:hypothetical protein
LFLDKHVWKNILGPSLFRLQVTADCSTDSVDACFEHDVRVSKIVPDHIDHWLVDVHEGTSRETFCGLNIVAAQINRLNLVCFVNFCAEMLFADG